MHEGREPTASYNSGDVRLQNARDKRCDTGRKFFGFLAGNPHERTQPAVSDIAGIYGAIQLQVGKLKCIWRIWLLCDSISRRVQALKPGCVISGDTGRSPYCVRLISCAYRGNHRTGAVCKDGILGPCWQCLNRGTRSRGRTHAFQRVIPPGASRAPGPVATGIGT